MIWRFYPMSIFMGLSAGAVAGLLVAILSGIVIAARTIMSGDAEMKALLESGDVIRALLERSDVQMAFLASSMASALAAGYATARSAFGEELVNATATGVIMVLGATQYRSLTDLLTSRLDQVSLALAVPLALAGALVFRGRTPPIARE